MDKKENNVRLIVINYGVDSLITPFRNLFNDCFAYYIREETLKKIIVHAPDKSIGHRTQKVQIIFNFISEFTSQNEFISEKRNSARLHLSLRKILPY